MTFKIYKDPKKMSLEELFQIQQKMQQEGKKQGQHYPMYTKRKAANGEQPSVDNMHEEATRDQLSHMYKQQNGTEKTKEPTSDDRVAQNLPKQGAQAAGQLRDGAELYGKAKAQQNSELYGLGYEAGHQGADDDYVKTMYGNSSEVWRGYAAGKEAARLREELKK